MRALQAGKSLVRQTAVEERHRPLVIALYPRMIAIRPKGTRKWFNVSYDVIFDLARKRDFQARS